MRPACLLYNWDVMPVNNHLDILGYGSVAVDDLLYVDHYPDSDSKIEVSHRERQAGGLTGTAMVTAARLGVTAGVFGVFGNNDLSQFTRDAFLREGIDISRLLLKEGANPIYSTIVIDQRTGERTIFFSTEGFNPIDSSEIPPDLLQDVSILFIDSHVLAQFTSLVSLARARGIPIVADIETVRILSYPEEFNAIDHLILSKTLAEKMTLSSNPKEILAGLASPQRRCSVITQGDQGCWIRVGEGPVFHLPAYEVDVVDTTGCGDVFHGAYAAALIHGEEPLEAVRWASASAALKATCPGGREGIPTLAALQNFLQAQSHIRLREVL